MKIDLIPVGKENKQTRQELMYKAKIFDENQFKTELAELKQNNIILFDNGYYIPNTKKELEEFIKKCNKQNYNTTKIIDLAYQMLEEMEKENVDMDFNY